MMREARAWRARSVSFSGVVWSNTRPSSARSSRLNTPASAAFLPMGMAVGSRLADDLSAQLADKSKAAAPILVRVARIEQTDGGQQRYLEVEPQRPVLAAVEVELGTFADLLVGVHLAAPAVDLRPASHAGLDLVTGQIAVHDLGVEQVVRLRGDRVRPRPNQRQRAHQRVEELRQFVDRGLADEAADSGHARVVPGHRLLGGRVALVDIHRAELVDLDHLVVEAMPLLLEEHRPLGVELNRK